MILVLVFLWVRSRKISEKVEKKKIENRLGSYGEEEGSAFHEEEGNLGGGDTDLMEEGSSDEE